MIRLTKEHDGAPVDGLYTQTNHGGYVQNTVFFTPDVVVEEGSWVFGNVNIHGKVRICDKSKVFGNTTIKANWVYIAGSRICNCSIEGNVYITKSAVCDNASITGDEIIIKQAFIGGGMALRGKIRVHKGVELIGQGLIYGNGLEITK